MDQTEFLQELRQMVVRRASSEHLVDSLALVTEVAERLQEDPVFGDSRLHRSRRIRSRDIAGDRAMGRRVFTDLPYNCGRRPIARMPRDFCIRGSIRTAPGQSDSLKRGICSCRLAEQSKKRTIVHQAAHHLESSPDTQVQERVPIQYRRDPCRDPHLGSPEAHGSLRFRPGKGGGGDRSGEVRIAGHSVHRGVCRRWPPFVPVRNRRRRPC